LAGDVHGDYGVEEEVLPLFLDSFGCVALDFIEAGNTIPSAGEEGATAVVVGVPEDGLD
jgi:hypothetical protein